MRTEADVMDNNPRPQGRYALARRHGSLIFTAGMTPRRGGELIARGRIASTEEIAIYQEALELACANAIAAARSALTEGEHLAGVLSFTVFIACEDTFERHSQLADFASDYLHREFGEVGVGTRAAIGVSTLPGGAPIEIQLVGIAGSR
ncbi:RidA family protein [Terrihabitans sp. B22-R8]|uniref:RidA family protein n=1 Tax=Terrihabitans sp. B22-R8 TaxID=3425128 RepID=UPI00403CA4F6